MADKDSAGAGNTAVPQHGDHDRVAMLSLKADGVPDQHNPEIIGDKEFALEATKKQFTEQAVSAVDQRERGVATGPAAGAEKVEQDPAIAELQKKHQAAEKAAVSAAESTVSALFTSDEDLQTGTAAAPGAKDAKVETPAKADLKK